jgi:hypothetical protein
MADSYEWEIMAATDWESLDLAQPCSSDKNAPTYPLRGDHWIGTGGLAVVRNATRHTTVASQHQVTN